MSEQKTDWTCLKMETERQSGSGHTQNRRAETSGQTKQQDEDNNDENDWNAAIREHRHDVIADEAAVPHPEIPAANSAHALVGRYSAVFRCSMIRTDGDSPAVEGATYRPMSLAYLRRSAMPTVDTAPGPAGCRRPESSLRVRGLVGGCAVPAGEITD
jgi:hypothetical protein